MACCGRRAKTRPPARQRRPSTPPRRRSAVGTTTNTGTAGTNTAKAPSGVPFRYVGSTALSFRGPVTGRSYRFTEPDAVLLIDPNDAAYLRNHPRLRREPRHRRG